MSRSTSPTRKKSVSSKKKSAAKRPARSVISSPLKAESPDAVRNYLTTLADRGIFRAFHEIPGRNGKSTFEFAWLFERPFRLQCDPATATLTFKDLLPAMPARSPEFQGVKAFVESKSDPALREHRRVDPKLAELACAVRAGNVSISLSVKRCQYTYGIRTLVNMTNELFTHLHMYEVGYLTVNFGLPEE